MTARLASWGGAHAYALCCGRISEKLELVLFCRPTTMTKFGALTTKCRCCAVPCCVLLLQHLPGLQHKQREFLVQHLGSPKQQQGTAEHLEQLEQQQQDAEETAV